jgi:hypothetical protein
VCNTNPAWRDDEMTIGRRDDDPAFNGLPIDGN